MSSLQLQVLKDMAADKPNLTRDVIQNAYELGLRVGREERSEEVRQAMRTLIDPSLVEEFRHEH